MPHAVEYGPFHRNIRRVGERPIVAHNTHRRLADTKWLAAFLPVFTHLTWRYVFFEETLLWILHPVSRDGRRLSSLL
jgi:hypothetical protein